ncbi:unnamed protein product [Schistosoma rodhaini]|uniref:Uncharacterized protein n=1 Tax=Schistosoma rodhaini TaxID=6188 RepID=A0AA85FT84_9TREM|nr:unnamed protein product [Schistosoma rodhaini]
MTDSFSNPSFFALCIVCDPFEVSLSIILSAVRAKLDTDLKETFYCTKKSLNVEKAQLFKFNVYLPLRPSVHLTHFLINKS